MQPGTSIGRYRIDSRLGAGAMGEVYRAHGPDGLVALKVLHPHVVGAGTMLQRFEREIRLGQAIRHPNVVATLDGGRAGNWWFLAMEYVEGQTLEQLLGELEIVPEELCRHIGREVAYGLAAIHEGGVLHRDVKPENVLITREHVVKVMDLGLARVRDESARLSQAGDFIGSLRYGAPEWFEKEMGEPDHRADLHSLGLVLYELATGIAPYKATSLQEAIRNITQKIPERVGSHNPQVSPFYEELVHTLLTKDPGGRFASARDVMSAFDQGEGSAWWRTRATALRSQTKRPLRRVRIPRETAVYGRDRELEQLGTLWKAVSAGEGRVVLLEGEAGVGKSRLVDEFVGQLQDRGHDLNFLFGSYPPTGAAAAAGAFSTAFAEHLGDEGAEHYLGDAPLLVPAFDALLRGDATPPGAAPLTPESMGTCFVHTLRALAAERPTVLLIDDLHFAPEAAKRLFTSLAMAVVGHPILLVGTTRHGGAEEWFAELARLDQTTTMELARLGPKDLIRLLEDTLDSELLAGDLAGQIALKSDGNPFFVFEILRGLREGQFIERTEDGRWSTTRIIEAIEIPSTVRDLVQARVARLTEEERDLLDVAACCGFEFDPSVVGASLGMPRVPTLKRFAQIERRHRLVRAAGRRMVFDHHQVQETLYEGLLEQLREAYHAGLGEAIEERTGAAETDPDELDGDTCVELCHHFFAGAEGRRGLRYLAAAKRHLAAGFANARLLELTERALAAPNLVRGRERAEMLLELGEVLDLMGSRARQEAVADEVASIAAGLPDGDTLLADAELHRSTVFWRTARSAEAAEAAERALAIARRIDDRRRVASAIGKLGNVLKGLGRLDEARERLTEHLNLVREIGDPAGEAMALANIGGTHGASGRLAEAEDHFERALGLMREAGSQSGVSQVLGNLGLVYECQGRMVEARRLYTEALELCRKVGNRQGEASNVANLGVMHQVDGRLDEARGFFERGLLLCRETGYRLGEVVALHDLGCVLASLGQLEGARDHLAESVRLAEQFDDALGAAAANKALGNTLAQLGDLDGARKAYEEARRYSGQVGLAGVHVLSRFALAQLPGGDVADAVAAFEEMGERLTAGEAKSARFQLWEMTGNPAHLHAAHILVEKALAQADPEERARLRHEDKLNRKIGDAWTKYITS